MKLPAHGHVVERYEFKYGQWSRRTEIRKVLKWPMNMGRLKVEKQILKFVNTEWLLYLHR